MPKVSVVVPVYNTEKYLRECIDSVLKQSFKDFEIVIVDDGSKDGSPQICDQYAEIDTRIKVIHKKNEGLSMARNDGLAHAKGEYVCFLDSDDFWIEDNSLSLLVDFADMHNGVFSYIEFNRSRYYPSEKTFAPCPSFPDTLEGGGDASNVIKELINKGIFPMSACTKFIRRDFLVSNNISFIKGIFSEDIPWFLDVLRNAEHPIYYLDTYIYGNRAEVSTSLTSTFSTSKYQDVLGIIDNQIELIKGDKWAEDVKESLYSFLAYRYCILLAQYAQFKKQLPVDLKVRTKKLKNMLKYDIHPKVNIANKIYKFFGLELTAYVLSVYMRKRDIIKKRK